MMSDDSRVALKQWAIELALKSCGEKLDLIDSYLDRARVVGVLTEDAQNSAVEAADKLYFASIENYASVLLGLVDMLK